MKKGRTLGDFTEITLEARGNKLNVIWLDNLTGEYVDRYTNMFYVLYDLKILINKHGDEITRHMREVSYGNDGYRAFKADTYDDNHEREGIWTFIKVDGKPSLDILFLDIDSIAYRFMEQVWNKEKS